MKPATSSTATAPACQIALGSVAIAVSVVVVTPDGLLELFDATTAAVADALGGVTDRRGKGERAGQYALDLATDAAAVEVLVAAGVGVLSEESGIHHPDRGITVVIDPVDGSSNCSRGIPWYACSLAAIDGEGLLASMVTNLASGTTYRATRGGGATRDGALLSVSGCSALGDAMVAINGWSPRHLGWRQHRTFGATALDMCLVAEGALDAYLDCADQNAPWDYLGAMLVVAEAGGVVSDVRGRELVVLDHGARRTPVAGATPALMEELAAAYRAVIS